jgi:ribosome maturation factor RimP
VGPIFFARDIILDLQKPEPIIEALIRPLIEQSGYTIYDVEFVGRTLRVSIERPDGTVSIDDCVETSRMINPLLDVEDVIPGGRYELEVSSPGLDRPLRRPEHFTRTIGEKIHVTTREPMSIWNGADAFFDKRKNVRGILVEFDGSTLKLKEEGGHDVVIPLDAVTRAYVDFELKTTPPPGNRQAKKGKNHG